MKKVSLYRVCACLWCMSFASYLFAQKAEFPLIPFADGTFNVKEGLFELGVKHVLGDSVNPSGQIKAGVRVPAATDVENQAVLDRSLSKYRIIAGGNKSWISSTRRGSNGKSIRIQKFTALDLNVEYGKGRFDFYPDSVKAGKSTVTESAYGAEAKFTHYFRRQAEFADAWTLYARIRYTRDIESGKKIGIVNSNPGGFGVVNELVVSEPTESQKLSPAVGAQFYPGTNVPITFASLFYYFFVSDSGKQIFNKERFRYEGWVFYYPENKSSIRVGIGVYTDKVTKGTEENDFSFGGLVNFKFDVNLIKTLF